MVPGMATTFDMHSPPVARRGLTRDEVMTAREVSEGVLEGVIRAFSWMPMVWVRVVERAG